MEKSESHETLRFPLVLESCFSKILGLFSFEFSEKFQSSFTTETCQKVLLKRLSCYLVVALLLMTQFVLQNKDCILSLLHISRASSVFCQKNRKMLLKKKETMDRQNVLTLINVVRLQNCNRQIFICCIYCFQLLYACIVFRMRTL